MSPRETPTKEVSWQHQSHSASVDLVPRLGRIVTAVPTVLLPSLSPPPCLLSSFFALPCAPWADLRGPCLWLPTGQREVVKNSGREEDRISIPGSLLVWGCDFWPWPCPSEATAPGRQYHSIGPAPAESVHPQVSLPFQV